MRFIFLLLMAVAPAALAHTPSESVAAQTSHVLTSPHHLLPFVLIGLALLILSRRLRRT